MAEDYDVNLTGASPNTLSGDITFVNGGGVVANKGTISTGNITIHGIDDTSINTGTNSIGDTAIVSFTGAYTPTLDLTPGTTDTIGGLSSLSGIGLVALRPGSTLTLDVAGSQSYSGYFFDNGTVVKTGAGSQTFTGTCDASLGAPNFSVNAGTLVVGSTTFGSCPFTVSGGRLKGNATLGNVSFTGGIIAPGNSPGTMNVTSLTLNSSSTFEEEITGSTAGTSYDQLIASGAVTLGNATLSVLPTYTPVAGTVFTIITAGSVSGTFNGLPDGSTVAVNGLIFRINYTNNTVTLTSLSDVLAPDTGLSEQNMLVFRATLALGLGLLVNRKRLLGFVTNKISKIS